MQGDVVIPDKVTVGAVPGVGAMALPENTYARVTRTVQVHEAPCFPAASPPAAAHSSRGPQGGRAIAVARRLERACNLSGSGDPRPTMFCSL